MNPPWSGFSAFQVFGDHMPMTGFVLVDRVVPDRGAIESLLADRSGREPPLDPELALATMRAGLGLVQCGFASFVYANTEEVILLVRPDAVAEAGQSLDVHDHLVSLFSARMAILTGAEVPARGEIYEFPNLTIARRAFSAALDGLEESTPARSSWRLGAQMRGRGEPFHPSMVETLEEQTSLLESFGVNMDALPHWWWRGIAGQVGPSGVQLHDDLPSGEEFARMVGI